MLYTQRDGSNQIQVELHNFFEGTKISIKTVLFRVAIRNRGLPTRKVDFKPFFFSLQIQIMILYL